MDVQDRDELERKIAREIARLLRSQMARLLEIMGDPPDVSRVTEEFWRDAGSELMEVLRPFLANIYLANAEALINHTSIGVDWALVNEAAAEWASRYTFDLVSGVNETSRRVLREAVRRYYEAGQQMRELVESLTRTFGPVRAEMIAVTEVTRAAVEGERQTVRELERMGAQLRPLWTTNNDELVCPICGPRHNRPIDEIGEYPPAHPRCRCWVNHEIVMPERA